MDLPDPNVRYCRKEVREEVQKRGRLVTTWQQHGIPVDVKDLSRFGARCAYRIVMVKLLWPRTRCRVRMLPPPIMK